MKERGEKVLVRKTPRRNALVSRKEMIQALGEFKRGFEDDRPRIELAVRTWLLDGSRRGFGWTGNGGESTVFWYPDVP
jgi:hypothetical protein